MIYTGPQTRYGKHARDSQRARVYDAEGALPSGQRFPDVAAMQTYTNQLLDSAWARRRFGRRSVTVKPGFGHRRATGGHGQVQMPNWARNERVLLHEIAHNLAGADAWHDPKFVRVYLELAEHVLGKEAAMKFRAAIREKRVKVGPALILNAVEATPKAPLRLVDRPFRVELKRRGKPAEIVTIEAKTLARAMEQVRNEYAAVLLGVTGIRIWQGREVKKAQLRAAAKTKTRV